MFKSIVKWVLKMVDISLSMEDGSLRIIVEFAGTIIIDRSIPLTEGLRSSLNWAASPKGVL